MNNLDKQSEEYVRREIPPYYSMMKSAYKAGYMAALDHLCKIPWDKAIKELEEHLKEKKDDSACK